MSLVWQKVAQIRINSVISNLKSKSLKDECSKDDIHFLIRPAHSAAYIKEPKCYSANSIRYKTGPASAPADPSLL